MNENRKRFSPGGLTHSAAHHLMAVAELLEQHGYARVSDIARRLDITAGGVSVAMQSLKEAGFVEQDENHFYRLTEFGRGAVAGVQARHDLVERFLIEVLRLTPEESHRESCQVENLIDGATAGRLLKLLAFWDRNRLGEAFEKESEAPCPACGGVEADQCPYCGLAWLERAGSARP